MGDIFFTCKSGSQNISGVPRAVDICANIHNQKQPLDEGGDHEEENREFKIPRRPRPPPRKRRLKSEFVFFQSLSRLFQLGYFVKCKRTLLEPNS